MRDTKRSPTLPLLLNLVKGPWKSQPQGERGFLSATSLTRALLGTTTEKTVGRHRLPAPGQWVGRVQDAARCWNIPRCGQNCASYTGELRGQGRWPAGAARGTENGRKESYVRAERMIRCSSLPVVLCFPTAHKWGEELSKS